MAFGISSWGRGGALGPRSDYHDLVLMIIMIGQHDKASNKELETMLAQYSLSKSVALRRQRDADVFAGVLSHRALGDRGTGHPGPAALLH